MEGVKDCWGTEGPLKGMASSRWSLCSRACLLTPACGRPATVHGYTAQPGVHPGSLHNCFTSVERSSCQEGNINHPAAGRAENSNSRFPCYGWQGSEGAPQPCKQGRRCQGPGVGHWGAGGSSHCDPGPQTDPGSTRRRLSCPDLPPGPTRLGGPATVPTLSLTTVYGLAPCHLSLNGAQEGQVCLVRVIPRALHRAWGR